VASPPCQLDELVTERVKFSLDNAFQLVTHARPHR
jgi:hypothetical protein